MYSVQYTDNGTMCLSFNIKKVVEKNFTSLYAIKIYINNFVEILRNLLLKGESHEIFSFRFALFKGQGHEIRIG